ncbi:porin family protein [Halomonas sp. MC140]|nr:porin family protein [Halomonas sp. MC140]MDN7132702.1 porin family protein [Halomonas sp. MC140]
MQKITLIGTVVVATLASNYALAQASAGYTAGTTYFGAQVAQVSYDADYIDSAEPPVFIAKVGHFVLDYVALEGRLGTSLNDDTITVFDTDVDIEVDHIAGLYAVGHLPLGSVASFYGVLGYTSAELTASIQDFSERSSDSGISYGGGIQGMFTPNVSGTVEYMSYLDKSDYDATAIGLGINYHF